MSYRKRKFNDNYNDDYKQTSSPPWKRHRTNHSSNYHTRNYNDRNYNNNNYNNNRDHYRHSSHHNNNNNQFHPLRDYQSSYNSNRNKQSFQRNNNNNNTTNRNKMNRAAIEECSAKFMNDINKQNAVNIKGIEQVKERYWNKSGWLETTFRGKKEYTKGNIKQTNKPDDIKDDNDYITSHKPYKWTQDVHKLTQNNNNKLNKSNTYHKFRNFKVRTNTYELKVNQNIMVKEYKIITTIKDKNNNNSVKLSTKQTERTLKYWKNRSFIQNKFGTYLISTGNIVSFQYKSTMQPNSDEKDQKDQNNDDEIAFPNSFHSDYHFTAKLSCKNSLQYYASIKQQEHKQNDNNNNNDNGSSLERGNQIFQAILNCILRECGLKYVSQPPVRGWFYTNINDPLCSVNSVYHNQYGRSNTDNIGVLHGINPKIHHTVNRLSFKVSNVNKIMHKQSIHDDLSYLSEHDAKTKYVGTKVLVLYSHKTITIKSMKFNQNEDTKFKLSNGDEISHANYLINKGYVTNVEREKCLIEDENGCHHLPQCLYQLLNDKNDKILRQDALIHLQKQIDPQLDMIQKYINFIVSKQNNTNTNNNNNNNDNVVHILDLLSLNKHPIETSAFRIPPIQINFKGYNDREQQCTELNISKEWRNVHGIYSAEPKPFNMLVIGQKNNTVNTAIKNIRGYFNKRNFQWKGKNVVNKIEQCTTHNIFDENEMQDIFGEYPDSHAMVILLPDNKDSSQLKRKMHRIMIADGIISQFIMETNLIGCKPSRARNVVWGLMADVMVKLGYTLYKINPKLSDEVSSILAIEKSLIFGLDVVHPTKLQTINRPSIPVLTTFRGKKLYEPNINNQKSALFFNSNKQEILSFDAMLEMVYAMFKKQFNRKSTKELPQNLLFLRDGISDSQIPEMVSKEMNGLKGAIDRIKHHKDTKQKFINISTWNPAIEFIIIQKRIPDRFGAIKDNNNNNNDISEHCPAFIMPWDVVSGEYFEFYLEIGLRNPSRAIFIRDDLNLKEYPGEAAKWLYSLHWMYPYIIPFNGGPVNVAGPIKWSDHYANTWQELICGDDNRIKDIEIHKNVNVPQIIKLRTC